MIGFLKRYWKYLLVFCSLIIVFTVSFFVYSENNKVEAKVSEKASSIEVKKEEKEIKEVEVETVFVDVKGAVNTPGVYELDVNKRVIDAINLAGGLTDKADTVNLNLSRKLSDEMYIIVYTKTELYNYKKESEKTCPTFECVCPDTNNDACISKNNDSVSDTSNNDGDSSTKISINSATKEQLMTLSGVGESKAEAIISYRNENGNFQKIEDIKNVSGIGDSLYEKIKDNLTL